MAPREKDWYGAWNLVPTATVDGRTCKEGRKVICLEESVSRCRLLAERWQTVDNISVFGGSMWTTLETLPKFDWIVAPGVLTEAHRYFTGRASGTTGAEHSETASEAGRSSGAGGGQPVWSQILGRGKGTPYRSVF